jgi:DNA-binding MarR family transcriptional regulator
MSQPFIDFNGLDTAVHGPVRLGMLTALLMDGPLDFTTLKERLGVGDGVLGMHARKLEDAGYIRPTKAFVGRRPKTTYHLTDTGREAFLAYLDAMQKLLEAVATERTKITSATRAGEREA